MTNENKDTTYTIKTVILNTVKDLAANFLYYDRKEDEELNHLQLIEAVKNDEVTIDEIVSAFKECLTNTFK